MQDFEKLGTFYLGRSYDLAKKAGDLDALVLYDSKDLVTHAVCVGMTGSGKTGLCLSLLEEAAIDGIPAIIIDPKGDLSNLLLTFPSLQGSEFLPWISEEDATRKGLTPQQHADQQAALQRQFHGTMLVDRRLDRARERDIGWKNGADQLARGRGRACGRVVVGERAGGDISRRGFLGLAASAAVGHVFGADGQRAGGGRAPCFAGDFIAGFLGVCGDGGRLMRLLVCVVRRDGRVAVGAARRRVVEKRPGEEHPAAN